VEAAAVGKLILVADDDDDVRELVVFRLERAGYRVLTASDGEQAVALALERRPDLCLLDVMMPGLDGYEVTRRLRAGGLGEPVLLLTASVQEAAVAEGLEAGADDYLKKPFAPQDLLFRVQSALDLR
jgi:DNA-binding response OmpR family regulator